MIVTKLWHLQKPNQLSSTNPTDALRIGHRGGLVNAQRFLEQINRLIAHAVERLDKATGKSPFPPNPASQTLATFNKLFLRRF